MPFLTSNAVDDQLLFERIDGFKGGMDSYTRPIYLPPDVSALAQNLLVKDNNLLGTRPGADSLGDVAAGANKVQGMVYYDTPAGTELLIAAVNKVIKKWGGSTWTNIAGYTLNTATLLPVMVQGNDLVYISDGVAQWQSLNGTAFTPLGTDTTVAGDPPVGATIACWHTHRMFASGVAASSDSIWVSGILAAGDGDWDHVYWKFRVGGGEGQAIKALCPATGFWMVVGKEGSIWMVNCDPTAATAAEWQVELLTNQLGFVGSRAWCRFGTDIMFMSRDGIRSLKRMSGTSGEFEVSPPMSEPIQNYIDRINWEYAHKICAHKYKEYALFAAPLDTATECDYVFVWNGRNNSWVSVWTGWTPTSFVTTRFSGVDALVIGDSVGRANEWKDGDDASLDATYEDNGTAVEATWRSRSMVFGDPVSNKTGFYCEARFINSSGFADCVVTYDDSEMKRQTIELVSVANQLPVDLPFDLADPRAHTAYIPLLGLGQFNECYIELSWSGAPVYLKNSTLAGFLDAVINE